MNANPYYVQTQTAQLTLVQRVSMLLCTALLVTAGAAAWAASAQLSPALVLPLAIGTLVCVFAMGAARRNQALGLGLLYVLSVLEGLLIGPVIGMVMRGYAQGPLIVAESASLSAILVGGLGAYAWISSKDFGGLGKTLFWALIGLIVVGVISMFINIGGFGQMLYALVGTAIFCGYVLYDVSNIKLRYGPEDAVIATVQLYLDFLNIFMFILQILTSVSGGSRRDD